jgi:TM2 domain-containing membrane protein YozV
MKKAIFSPLCSALVIPGLGQVINGQVKKGIILLGVTFILFLLTVFQLYRILRDVLEKTGGGGGDSQPLTPSLVSQDGAFLWIVLGLFALVWVYSVLDAFVAGRNLDRAGEVRRS